MNDRTVPALGVDAPLLRSPSDGLPLPRRYWSLATIWAAMAMAVLDGVVVNLVLPVIASGMHADATAVIWIINVYQIAIIMLLLPFAALGEILGFRKTYLGGIVLFAAASLGCALSQSLGMLVACRFVQGVGAAALMSINGALLRSTFPARDLGRGMGYNAVLVSITSAAGPSIAAGALALGSWRILFLLNLPVAVAVLATGIKSLPVSERIARPFDWQSAALNAACFGSLFLLSVQLSDDSIGVGTLLLAALVLASSVALVRRARADTAPLIPLDLLAVASLRISYAASIGAFAAQMLMLVTLPFYLQPRFSHVAIGLLMTSFPVGVLCGAPLSGRFTDHAGAGRLGLAGLALMSFGLVGLFLDSMRQPIIIVACLAVAGFGIGLFQTPNNHAMMRGAPKERSGVAAGMMAVCRLLGQTVGTLGAALSFHHLGTASSVPFLFAAGFAAAAALSSSLR